MKTMILIGTLAGVVMFFTGCASPMNHVNATGIWSYRYADKKSGTMTLHQNDYKLTGIANDENGEYKVTGDVNGSQIVITGKASKDNKSIKATGTFLGNGRIDGEYISAEGVHGEWNVKRK